MHIEGMDDDRVLARFDEPRSADPVRIAVLGDVHLATLGREASGRLVSGARPRCTAGVTPLQ